MSTGQKNRKKELEGRAFGKLERWWERWQAFKIKSWSSMTDEKLQQQIERWQETMMQRFGVRNVAWGFKGKKHSHDTKKKMSEKATERKGEKNSQFGTCWIMKNGQSVKIKTEQIEQFIQDGWTKGRTLKRKQ
jgi:hypothetical protein